MVTLRSHSPVRRGGKAARAAAAMCLWLALASGLALARSGGHTLKVFLMCGQSNMEGDGYAHQEGDDWLAKIGYPDSTALEFLVNHPDYRKKLDAKTYSMLAAFSADWLSKPRSDAWAIHMDCGSGKPFRVQNTTQSGRATWKRREAPLQPGFGRNANDFCRFGPELGLGHYLGERLKSPLYFYKSDRGGTALATAWRPPSAAKKRGGDIGSAFTNTIRTFKAFLKTLDADLAADGKLNKYNGATGVEVCAFVWLQGWNDAINAGRRKEYKDNLLDLVRDVRSELGLPKLPAVIVESADNNAEMNVARKAAVAALNKEQRGSAVFVPTGDLKKGYRGGFHFEARAENYLEIGWRTGKAIIENGYTGSESVPGSK